MAGGQHGHCLSRDWLDLFHHWKAQEHWDRWRERGAGSPERPGESKSRFCQRTGDTEPKEQVGFCYIVYLSSRQISLYDDIVMQIRITRFYGYFYSVLLPWKAEFSTRTEPEKEITQWHETVCLGEKCMAYVLVSPRGGVAYAHGSISKWGEHFLPQSCRIRYSFCTQWKRRGFCASG